MGGLSAIGVCDRVAASVAVQASVHRITVLGYIRQPCCASPREREPSTSSCPLKPMMIMSQYHGMMSSVRPLAARIQQLLSGLVAWLRQWLAESRHPIRAFQLLLAVWKRRLGRVNRSGENFKPNNDIKKCNELPVTTMTICASRVPESSNNGALAMTFLHGAHATASSNTLADSTYNPVTLMLPSMSSLSHSNHGLRPGASFQDIPGRSPTMSQQDLTRNRSTPNLTHANQQRAGPTTYARSRRSRPASRISGRAPPSINNRSSAALTIVRHSSSCADSNLIVVNVAGSLPP
jgi:hypothetical protein